MANPGTTSPPHATDRAPELDALRAGLHPLEVKALAALEGGAVDEAEISARGRLEPEQVRTAVQWLLAKGLIGANSTDSWVEVSLTESGAQHAEHGVPETRILGLLARGAETGKPLTMAALAAHPELAGEDTPAAAGGLKKLGAIAIAAGGALELADRDRASSFVHLEALIRRIAGAEGPVRLDQLPAAEQTLVEENARKRGKGRGAFRLADRSRSHYALTETGRELARALGGGAAAGLAQEVSQVTPELLRDGSWRSVRFRRYNLGLRPARTLIGRRHPYAAFLDRVRDKFMALGFEEMRGDLVESEFWNMDALFMPQFHSARDIHDVYHVKEPSHAREIEQPFGSSVAAAHESGGGTGSRGWRYRFDLERTRRLVLRSQGTALSARTLAGGAAVPGKYFAIARCFRYDQVDATHASDFFQIEGIVLGEKIDFRHLLGLLRLFAVEVAQAKETRFTPGYFPFTEPSVELHVNHPVLGWMELGGAGIFRPELVAPLGVHATVLAWGLGLDRMAMNALGIDDIRQLFTTDLEFMRTAGRGGVR
jgi:phenylalanyl-tRNA synthetase alpha chain